MSKVSIILTCTTCGNNFRHESYKHSSREAESYAEWAKSNICTCPACYAAKKQSTADKAYRETCASLDLPDITNGTDKQISFAHSLRREFLQQNSDVVKMWLDNLRDPEFEDRCREYGKTVAEAIAENRALDPIYDKAYLTATATDAKALIDALK